MISLDFSKQVPTFLVALATLVLAASSASAGPITLDFNELLNGDLELTGTDSTGAAIDVTKPASETFRVSAPNCACSEDFSLNQIGTSTEYLVNIFESDGVTLSDQVWVHRLGGAGSQVIEFFSDLPAVTPGAGAVISSVVETGSLQSALTYTSSGGTAVTVNISSPIVSSPLPEPATLALLLLGIGLAGVTASR